MAIEANKAEVRNNASSGARLPEADKAEMDVYLGKMLQLLPVLGIRSFQLISDNAPQRDEILYHEFKGLKSTGARTTGGFVVYKGSQAVIQERPSSGDWGEKRNKLRESGILTPKEDYLVFSRDIEFTSPSAAAAIIQGGPANGLTIWKNAAGKSLKEMETDV